MSQYFNYRFDYVWIDIDGKLRSKNRIELIDWSKPIRLEDIPIWNYDGSSTGQAPVDKSEIQLKPVNLFYHPYNNNAALVLCETYVDIKQDIPAPNNNRHAAAKIFDKCLDQECWFGLEQEYFIMEPTTKMPLGWVDGCKQGQYYCGVGTSNAFGRYIVDEHLAACLRAGVKICGTNGEVAPGQWEFQIGPLDNINAADHLWIARYILELVAEYYQLNISYDPKPLADPYNGSGCHINFSTASMRQPNGYDSIISAIDKLKDTHEKHMEMYGVGNENRLNGRSETSSHNTFTYGVADRTVSIRIPQSVYQNNCGYFEDRRPAANCDPYLATSVIASSVCL